MECEFINILRIFFKIGTLKMSKSVKLCPSLLAWSQYWFSWT